MDSKTRSKSGSQAANVGIANEHISLGILMHKYNASKVDLPSSKFDLILLHKEKYIRIQVKTSNPSIAFKGNVRAGKANRGSSDPDYGFRYNRSHCDILMGVRSKFNNREELSGVDLYFLPTILVEKIKNTNGISTNCLQALKYNYEILENCQNEKFILKKIKEYQQAGSVKIQLK
tara:strand:- start:141 stop:668 length:528 start_codon:yes stop_codon:yes gene_type:complete